VAADRLDAGMGAARIASSHAQLRDHTDRYCLATTGPTSSTPTTGGAVRSTITIDERFGQACLQGLDAFSHVGRPLHRRPVPGNDNYREPRPYRARSDLPPVGVFAGRGPPQTEPEWVSRLMSEYFQP
jgi:hypothetical protein